MLKDAEPFDLVVALLLSIYKVWLPLTAESLELNSARKVSTVGPENNPAVTGTILPYILILLVDPP